jgi:hypothetical protein
MRGLERRLATLEAGRKAPELVVIHVQGGLGGEPQHASGGGMEWHRGSGERMEAFKARAVADGKEAGAAVLILGGLPNGEWQSPR